MKNNQNKKIVIFDGVCNLCNNAVKTIILFDKKDIFRFTSLQSELGQKIISKLNIDSKKTDSIIIYNPDESYTVKSSAVLKIINEFGILWKPLQLCWIIPEKFRDLIYDIVARNRYKWFGRKQKCMIPTKEIINKFL